MEPYGSPLPARPSSVESSPLSSETTALQTVAKLDPGSSVNDGSPWYDVKAQPLAATTNCPHSYPQVWTGRPALRRNLPQTARGIGARYNQQKSLGQEADPPSSLRCRAPFRSETALPEANSFPFARQPFCNIGTSFQKIARRPRGGVTSVNDRREIGGRGGQV